MNRVTWRAQNVLDLSRIVLSIVSIKSIFTKYYLAYLFRMNLKDIFVYFSNFLQLLRADKKKDRPNGIKSIP